jgi:hypothetical protein
MTDHPPRGRSRRPISWIALPLLSLPLLLGGCAVLGLAASAVPEGDIPARYKDLRGHSVAALAWSHRGLETDYPALRLDLISAVHGRLQTAQKAGRGELKEATFPHAPASMVRFQEDHPELERSPIINVAPRLSVQRLIYIEVENFQTRSEQAVDLFRGQATVSLRVIEVEGGNAKVAYEESGLTVTYPPAAPIEGVPGAGDARIYRGTVDQLATVIAKRFYAHPSGK